MSKEDPFVKKIINDGNKMDWGNMQEKVEGVLGEDFWSDIAKVIPRRGPCIDFFETTTEEMLVIELPGLESQNHLKVNVSGNQVIITGHIPYPYPIPKEELKLSERYFGKIKRVIAIPFSFNPDDISAHFKNGLLVLKIPKIHQEKNVDIYFNPD